MRSYKNLLSTVFIYVCLLVQVMDVAAHEPELVRQSQPVIEIELSRERIDAHKQDISKLLEQRKWGRRGVRCVQAVSTLVTMVELFVFAKDLLAAANGEVAGNAVKNKEGNRIANVGKLIATYGVIAAAQTITGYVLRRYYEQVMQEESISWYVFTQAFYKVNCAELKQQATALQEGKDASLKLYQQSAVISAHNSLIKQLEKIIAFMEHKLEHMPIQNRPEARSLTNHLFKSGCLFANAIKENSNNQFFVETVLAELTTLESIIDREMLRFSRLEGNVALTENQYNALLQVQSA